MLPDGVTAPRPKRISSDEARAVMLLLGALDKDERTGQIRC
ncbi:hypothetical protein [Streptomyces sp. NPDC058401]